MRIMRPFLFLLPSSVSDDIFKVRLKAMPDVYHSNIRIIITGTVDTAGCTLLWRISVYSFTFLKSLQIVIGLVE